MDSRFNQFKEKMEKSFTSLKNEFQTIRAGRANPKVLDKVLVDYYGTKTPLNQMANFSVPEARILIVQPFDKSAIKDIVIHPGLTSEFQRHDLCIDKPLKDTLTLSSLLKFGCLKFFQKK